MNTLYERALELENDIEKCLIDEHGLLMSSLNIETMQPFPRGYFAGKNIYAYPGRSWDDFSEFIKYENVGMCSGAYLAAMACKYKTTKDAKTLRKAYRTFKGIKWLFDLSQEIEEGFYCKCYGGKLSEQLSSDQYIYTFAGLEKFMQFADSSTRRQCIDMIEKMVRFWIRNNYSYQYFGNDLDWPLERFPVFSWLAWIFTKKQEFRQEFNRLCSLDEVKNRIPFGQYSWDELINHTKNREPVFHFEKNSPFRVLRLNPENTESGFLSLEAMLKYNAPHQELWLDKVRKMFCRDKRWIAENGYARGPALYNIKTGEITEIRKPLNIPETSDWKFFGLVSNIRSAMHSAMFARAAVAINSYLPGLGGLEISVSILKNLQRDNLHWYKDMDGKQLPDDLNWMDKVYSGDAATHWLWAYWEASTKYETNRAGKNLLHRILPTT